MSNFSHFHCSSIVFQLHLDYILILHFDCIFIALDYDCIIITLRLHFYYITFGLHFDYTTIAMMQSKCNLNYCCGINAFQLHFNCMKLLHFDCIFVALHLDCKNITFRLHFHYMTFGLHFDCTTIAILQS